MRRRIAIAAIGAVVLGVWLSSRSTVEPGGYDWHRIDGALEGMVNEYGISGASMIVLRHGEVIYDRSLGDFDGNTVVTAGSASKWAGAAAIMTLVDEGKLSLDQPLVEVLPSFGLDDRRERITLRHALAHQSGMANKHPCLREYEQPLRRCVAQIARSPLLFPPGTRFNYGALSYQSAAGMAEAVTDLPWRDVFRTRLTEPLGMVRTDYGRYGRSNNPGVAGNLNTSRDDFATFLQMMLDGGMHEGKRLISEALVKQMLRGQTSNAPRMGHIPKRHTMTTHDLYGLGVWRDVVGPNGGLLVGSSPGKFGFVPWIDWRYGIVGVLSAEFTQDIIDTGVKPPDPSAVVAMVCNVVDRAANGTPKVTPNPNCKLTGLQRRVPSQAAPPAQQ
jgi:CubicO group peptidase (beta-lactamase class C family)